MPSSDKPPITNWFRGGRAGTTRPHPGPMNLRRFESAKTDRLNAAHWSRVNSATINQDLLSDLETIRSRASYEIHNNATLYGMIETYAADVLGAHGPHLQVQTKRSDYARTLERLWREWWAMPDVAGRLSGVDMMAIWERLRWSDGEYLVQIVTDRDATGAIKTRLNNLSPRRLGTPVDKAFSGEVMLGIHRNTHGKPIAYYIDLTPESSIAPILFNRYQPVRAEDIIHDFDDVEPGQIRGIPLLASSLQSIADMRDFDATVLDAARASADASVFMRAVSPDVEFQVVNDEVELERGVMRTLPPGYDLASVAANQPASTYVEFRNERLREMGRAVGMPLMMIKLDSSDHNYSSARFDGQIYYRVIKSHRCRLERRTLNRLVGVVAREAELAQSLPMWPDDLQLVWDWPAIPHVDPLKEALAVTERLNNGTASLQDELPGDLEEHIAKLKRVRELLEAAGLPATPLRSVGIDKLAATQDTPNHKDKGTK